MMRKYMWIIALLMGGMLLGVTPVSTTAQPDQTYQFVDVTRWQDASFHLFTCDNIGCDYDRIEVGTGLYVHTISPSDLPGHITLVRNSTYKDETRLTTVDLTGHTVRNIFLPTRTGPIGHLSIHPDGDRIALSPQPGRGHQIAIWHATPDADTAYTLETSLDGFRAQWSPDGRYLVYQNALVDPLRFGNERPHWRVMLYDPDAHFLHTLALSSDLFTDCYAPLWWSDNEVLYRCTVPGYDFDPVFRTNIDTHETERWLEPGVPGCLHIAPDRSQLAFLAPERHLYIWDVATQTMQTITAERFAPSCSAIWIQ